MDSHTRTAKPGGVSTPLEALDRRRKEATALTSQSKDATLRTKRLKREASAVSLGGFSREPSTASLGAIGVEEEDEAPLPLPDNVAQLVHQAVEDIKASADTVGCVKHLEAVKSLRQLLSAYEDPPYEAALAAGAVPALITALQPPLMNASSQETVFEAAWCLTNLAVGQSDVVDAIVPAAPVLIAYLGGGSGSLVADQCAWALGNIAGEDAQYRQLLIANGAVLPLCKLVVDAGKAQSQQDVSAGTTAAWALSNLLKGEEAADVAARIMSIETLPQALITLLDPSHTSATEDAVIEAGWLLAYIMAAPNEMYLNRLVHLGILPPLTAQIVQAAELLLQNQPVAFALLPPLLRSLGNIIGGGGKDTINQVLEALQPVNDSIISPLMNALLTAAAAQGSNHGLQREAAWVLSNIAGLPGRAGVDALKSSGSIPVLKSLLIEQPYHVRKEAAFALTNICAGGGGGSGDAEIMNQLFGGDLQGLKAMVSLMRSADVDAALLGLQFLEMYLRLLGPSAADQAESADAIDALEQLQYGEDKPDELKRHAAVLVDTYWSIDNN